MSHVDTQAAFLATTPSRRNSALMLFVGSQTLLLVIVVRNLLLIPICLRYIAESVFGAWLALSGVLAFLCLADFGINNLLVQRTAKHYGARDWTMLGKTIASGLATVLVLASAVFLAAQSVASQAPAWMGLDEACRPEFVWAVRLAIVDAVLLLGDMSMSGVLLGLQRPAGYLVGLIVGQAFGIVLTLVLLAWGMQLLAVPAGMLAGTVVAFAVNVVVLRRLVRTILPSGLTRFDLATARDLLKASGWLFVVRLARVFVLRSNGMIVAIVLSAPLVIVYEVTWKASLLITDAIGRISQSLFPGLVHLGGAGEHEKMRKIVRLQIHLITRLGLLAAGLVFVFNRGFVGLWTGDRYFGGNELSGLLCLYAVVQLWNTATYSVVFAVGRIKRVTVAALCEAVLQISLSIFLGALWGLRGIAIAAMAASFSGLVIQGLGLIAVLECRFSWRSVLRATLDYAAVAAVQAAAATFVLRCWPPDGWCSFALVVACSAALGGTVLVLGDAKLRSVLLHRGQQRT